MGKIRKEAGDRARFYMHQWGAWSGKREFFRGLFHLSVGLANWVLIQFVGASLWMIGTLLFLIGAGVFSLDHIRVHINRSSNLNGGWLGKASRWVSAHLIRESEQYVPANVLISFWGLGVAWFCCLLADAPWIAAAVGMIFSFVDPIAKLGRYWPLGRRFTTGPAKGKSLGGFVWGGLGGLVGVGLIVLLHMFSPFFPSSIPVWYVCMIFFVGVLTAVFAELWGGKMDNFLIPACSSIVMVVSYLLYGILL